MVCATHPMRFGPFKICSTALFLVFVTSGVVRAAGESLLAEFRANYPNQSAKLDAMYSQVTIVTTETQWDQTGKFIWTYGCQYLRDGDRIRKIQNIIKSDYPEMPSGTVRALGGSSDKFFIVRKRDTQQHFAFTDFGPKVPDEFDFESKTECYPVFAVCNGDALNINEYVTRSDVNLISADSTLLDGVRVNRIVTDQTMADGRVRTQFFFLPETWAFAGWTRGVEPTNSSSDPQHLSEIRVTYALQNPNRIESIDKWITSATDRRQKLSERMITVVSIQFGAVAPNSFSVASLGVSEPVLTPPSRPVPWLLIGSIPIFFALGIWLTVLARRRSRLEGVS
jgi:hypothetical protein